MQIQIVSKAACIFKKLVFHFLDLLFLSQVSSINHIFPINASSIWHINYAINQSQPTYPEFLLIFQGTCKSKLSVKQLVIFKNLVFHFLDLLLLTQVSSIIHIFPIDDLVFGILRPWMRGPPINHFRQNP